MDTDRLVIAGAEELLGRYFPVLDHGFVSLIDYMGGDLSIERAARCSYVIGHEVRGVKETRHLIRYLMRHRHTSPFEQVEFQFHIGLPIFVMRQLVRHRTANLNEFSGRYSVMPLLFYTPPSHRVCVQSQSNRQGSGERVSESYYDEVVGRLDSCRATTSEIYRDLIDDGVAKEIARIDLPLSTYTYAYWKMDLRNLLHLIGLRSDPHAQEEVRGYSDVFAGVARAVAPLAFEAFLDYQFEGATFGRAEMELIREVMLSGYGGRWEEETGRFGIFGREHDEFVSKLRPRERRDFSLDASRAKDASYFMDLVNRYAIERPNTATVTT